ncbi:MAG TPA: rRNA maturation RNase YbeY [Candidatus Acidoferrales bacterium]|nr:rRNA maturation RNase YbeY [Candidatus Acidoferrales bacterium]
MTGCLLPMVINRQHRFRIALKPLEAFLRRARRELGLSGRELTICLVSDAAIARMNRAFRGKRGPTDVLSFPAGGAELRRGRGAAEAERDGGEAYARKREVARRARGGQNRSSTSYLGDVAISAETARRNARRLGRSLPYELRVLMLHGVLHLAGYDHEADGGEMDRLELRLRERLGLS